jgi:hypothetical protein
MDCLLQVKGYDSGRFVGECFISAAECPLILRADKGEIDL